MKNLKFRRLLVLSNSERSANQFQFGNRINLITANENNVGKSTILKLLLWTLGCEPAFDTTWKNLDPWSVVEFDVDDVPHTVARYHDVVLYRDEAGNRAKFDKISGEYSRKFAEIVDFRLLLPNRQEVLETPPPAYYFLPFYIDQKRSWRKPWDGFENLLQYADWKRTLIDYHTGLLTPEFFRLEEERHQNETRRRSLEEHIARFSTAIEVFGDYVPKASKAVTIDERSFEVMTDEIRETLSRLASDQEKLLSDLADAEVERSYLQQQRSIIASLVEALEADYKFSVENVRDDELECPLCGTLHKSTAVERAAVLADKQSAVNQLAEVDKSIETLGKRLEKYRDQLTSVKNRIGEINSRYVEIEGGAEKQPLSELIETFASRSVEARIKVDQQAKLGEKENVEGILKRVRKEQRDLRLEDRAEEIRGFFEARFVEFAQFLKTDQVNLSSIRKPTDYTKVEREGGAAENTRMTLAYSLAIYAVAEKYGTSAIPPLMIDTPNQQEQSDPNYDSILHLVLNGVSQDGQILLCAMMNPHLEPFMPNANVISLDESRILQGIHFDQVRDKIDWVFAPNQE